MTKNTLLRTLASTDPAALSPPSETDEINDRILTAAFEQIAAVGWRRSTVEDVAKRAGLGRATVYRRFSSKDALITAVTQAELRTYLAGAANASGEQPTILERMTESAAYTFEFIRNHPLLGRLLETEPEAILPALTTEAGPLIETFREFCAKIWENEIYGDTLISPQATTHLRTVAELHVRIALSLILTKQTAIEIDTGEQARQFARRYLAPMLDAHADDVGSSSI